MNLREWAKRDSKKTIEITLKSLDKCVKGQKIDILEDLLPELKHLKGKNYTVIPPGRTLDRCETIPKFNLGLLLGSGLYDNAIVPLEPFADKSTFEISYGLSVNRGSHVSFDHFISLIKEGKLFVYLVSSPREYKAEFYKEIFKSCDELPSLLPCRTEFLARNLRCAILAHTERIEIDKVLKLHPQYDLVECVKEVEEVFGDYLVKFPKTMGFIGYEGDMRWIANFLATNLWSLRVFGFERLSELALKCARLDKEFGSEILMTYNTYLTWPISGGLFATTNYSEYDINRMSFIKALPKKLEVIWKDVLSSSPVASSLASCQIGLDTVELGGMELLRLIEDLGNNKNAVNLRQKIVDVNKALSNYDFREVEKSFNKIDEIITENINSEIRDYQRKGHIAIHLLRFGKTFAAWTTHGLTMLAGLIARSEKFEWFAAALAGTGASLWTYERLREIKAEDIVRWWSKIWPFKDPGIGFVMWEKAQQKRK